MRKLIIPAMAFASLMLFSCGQNASQQSSGSQGDKPEIAAQDSKPASSKSDHELIMEFLNEIYNPQDKDSERIFEDEWVFKHCSKKMQQQLRDEFEYDGEGWASWIIGGWAAGEDCPIKMTSITNEGSNYFIVVEPTGYCLDFEKGKRTIRLTINVVDSVPVIDECKWTTDFESVN